ncbi:HSP20-like chaperone [Pseudomassariella vexata]|uniref:HSP20-like chaperone n=1 Tax=Pseudomassariella vexata TaxID=1141098 RepID=A0A1Y2E3B2_9PEZI|nr:HSP20-like chaperone [Pseudomassariella vexata]ORY66040.1 HSP20-like chaperone [Pseudomassariella vexata]
MSLLTPRFHRQNEPNYSGLFRLIDDFDRHAQVSNPAGARRSPSTTPTFNPKFDLKEFDDAYELQGEVAGIAKEDIHIEFTDPQTIVISGKIERTHTTTKPDPVMVDHCEDEKVPTPTSFKATVEDEEDEDGSTTTFTTQTPTPATTVAERAKAEVPVQKKPVSGTLIREWITERNVGRFTRSFTFPSRIECEGTKADLIDGVVYIVVPKARKYEPRRIAIF